ADSVDNCLSALAHLDGFVEMDAALVVIAVGYEDHGFAHGFLPARCVEEFIAAGGVYRVVHGGAAARTEPIDSCLESVDVVGPVGFHVGGDVEPHYKGAVAASLEDLKEKLDGGLLFELEAGADRCAGVNDNADTEGQVDLLAEGRDLLGGLLIIEEGEAVLLEV